jgi:RimJ/RimL family protein N-acetyltransferase
MDTLMLTGSLVRLRAIEARDLDHIAGWRSDPRSYDSFFEFGPLPTAGQEEWYRRHCFNDKEKNFAIEPAIGADGTAIGMIAVLNIDWRSRHAELGRLLIGERRYRGLGYAPEAIALTCEYAFDHLNLHKVYCEVLASQVRVISMHRKLGAVDEGIRKEHVFKRGLYEDVVILALFREEYVRRNRYADVRDLAARRAAKLSKAAFIGDSTGDIQ